MVNNFDLIRLLAAMQVAIAHASKHLKVESVWFEILHIFPGVPIFFFISGFLIYGSYEKSLNDDKNLRNFYFKRILRLYPALFLYLIFCVFILQFSGYLIYTQYDSKSFFLWIIAQSSFFQFYNPDFLRGFGVGVVNGSLWTISVEIQFYLLTPFLYKIFQKKYQLIFFILLLFCLLNILNGSLNQKETLATKLINVSFIPWFYMFMLGALISKFKKYIAIINRLSLIFLIASYILIYFISKNWVGAWGNLINPLGFLILSSLILKVAFLRPYLSDLMLKRNDISYGVYIFHMPIINLFVYKNYYGFYPLFFSLLFTVCIAIFSWFFVESYFLKLKRNQQPINSFIHS